MVRLTWTSYLYNSFVGFYIVSLACLAEAETYCVEMFPHNASPSCASKININDYSKMFFVSPGTVKVLIATIEGQGASSSDLPYSALDNVHEYFLNEIDEYVTLKINGERNINTANQDCYFYSMLQENPLTIKGELVSKERFKDKQDCENLKQYLLYKFKQSNLLSFASTVGINQETMSASWDETDNLLAVVKMSMQMGENNWYAQYAGAKSDWPSNDFKQYLIPKFDSIWEPEEAGSTQGSTSYSYFTGASATLDIKKSTKSEYFDKYEVISSLYLDANTLQPQGVIIAHNRPLIGIDHLAIAAGDSGELAYWKTNQNPPKPSLSLGGILMANSDKSENSINTPFLSREHIIVDFLANKTSIDYNIRTSIDVANMQNMSAFYSDYFMSVIDFNQNNQNNQKFGYSAQELKEIWE